MKWDNDGDGKSSAYCFVSDVPFDYEYLKLAVWNVNDQARGKYMLMNYCPWNSKEGESDPNNLRQTEYTYNLWKDLLTDTYGGSGYKNTNEDVRQTTLWDVYNSIFKNDLNKVYYGHTSYPVEIWRTSRCNICLASVPGGWYFVLVEPLV